MHEVFLIIHDVRSIYNVASMFRTADGMGVSKIYLTGYTPAPVDRFGRKVGEFKKVALGAEGTVPWERRGETLELTLGLIQELQNSGIKIVALEQDPKAHHSIDVLPHESVALIVGNEVGGIPQEILEAADTIFEIPMHGAKESLNVSVATGIALYMLSTKLRQ